MATAHFLALQTETGGDRNCAFLIQKVSDDYYFFGNSLLACMGYDPPHTYMDQVVDKKDQHRLESASGVYLHESTVLNITKDGLKDFVTNYIRDCKAGSRDSRCPQTL